MSEKEKKPERSHYKSPKNDPAFVRRWKILCPEVMRRDNFKEAHLHTLELLCDLYVEYDRVKDLLDVTGYSYMDDTGRSGKQAKPYPEVAQMNQLRNHIATYTKILGFVLTPDKIMGDETKKDEWS